MQLALCNAGKQLQDRRVEGQQLHAMSSGERQQPRIRDLAVATHAAGAMTQYFCKPEIKGQKLVMRVSGISQKEFRDLADFHESPCERRLANDTQERTLRERASRPPLASVRFEPPNHPFVVFVRRPRQGNQGVRIQQIAQGASSSKLLT
nr:hypothetical protein [Variovorax sp. dw_308]